MTVRPLLRWAGRGVLVLVLLLIAAGVAIYFWLQTSLPKMSGTLTLPGLTAEVRVTRDAVGIPHIFARNVHDADFALGFVHAQDRIFQMDILRRYGAGRLSELAGRSTLGRDRFMRTLGLYRAAERQLGNLSAPVRQTLQAYADGVNAYIAQHSGAPHPYYLVVPGPEKWRPIDTLVIGKIMALYLAQNFRRELEHAQLATKVSPKQLQQLYPAYPKDGFVTLAALAALYRRLPLDRLAAQVPAGVGLREASNNWVLDGRHTVTGKPILENDPHLTYTAPSIWYLQSVETPHLQMSGATIPGVPFLVLGHNGRVGWGFTETGGDVADLFVEKVDPDNPDHYLSPQGSLPFVTRRETIHVRGAPDVTMTVRSTRHGPVISDLANARKTAMPNPTLSRKGSGDDIADAVKAAIPGKGYVLALQATFLEDGDKTPEALWKMNRARDWPEFRDALEDFGAPQMNIVYGDTDGTIAFAAPGRIPVRKKGDGWLPQPGWTGDYDWTGYIPFDQLPRKVDPSDGRFISANNKIVPDSYPYFLSRDWAPPYRARRIADLLDATPKQSLESTAAIAADTLSLMAKQLLPRMLRAPPADQRSEAALKRLQSWDGRMDRDQVAPLLFVAWLRELDREIFADELGNAFEAYWSLHSPAIRDILAGEQQWCDASSKPAGNCLRVLSKSLQTALDHLAKRFGDDMSSWRWGEPHVANFHNPVLSRVPLLGGLFALAIPAGGGSETINAGDIDITNESNPYADILGPGLRMILDFSDLANSRFLMSPGESGNPLSPHYGDLLRRWRDFGWMTIARAKPAHSLRLVPK